MSGTLENLCLVVKTIPKGPKNMLKTSKNNPGMRDYNHRFTDWPDPKWLETVQNLKNHAQDP